MLRFLQEQGVNETLLRGLETFKKNFPWNEKEQSPKKPRYLFFGKEIWEQAIAAILAGENLLLTGAKATGKNVLAENLAFAFGRGEWNLSMHINVDASFMIGSDTFADGKVSFRAGPVYQCAKLGGFCILDEINMARNEALAVLHSILDFRRTMDVPFYDRLELHPATRFIATMNYAYAGTRELNEALASRFVVLHLPIISHENLSQLLDSEFKNLRDDAKKIFIKLFFDLEKKCANGEISSKAVDLRGMFDALRLVQMGLSVRQSLAMGITGKVFDDDERILIDDAIALNLPDDLQTQDVFVFDK